MTDIQADKFKITSFTGGFAFIVFKINYQYRFPSKRVMVVDMERQDYVLG